MVRIPADVVEAFLKELTELTYKYSIEIVGCGCCGSPWVNQEKEMPPGYRYTLNEEEDRLKFGVVEDENFPIRRGEWA